MVMRLCSIFCLLFKKTLKLTKIRVCLHCDTWGRTLQNCMQRSCAQLCEKMSEFATSKNALKKKTFVTKEL